MLIVGLHNDEDAGVCLLKDGVLLESLNEERLTREKLHAGFPHKSLAFVLDRHGLTIDDIDAFAYGWHGRRNDPGELAVRLTDRVLDAVTENPAAAPIVRQRIAVEVERDRETRQAFEGEMAKLGVAPERIHFFDHHGSHAWAAFACAPFDEALVFSVDGRGDFKSATVSRGGAGGLTEVDYTLSMDSLGFLYGQITHFLGYRPHRHEGKITGLAGRGNPDATLALFESLVEFRDGRFHANIGPYKPFYTDIEPELAERYAAHSAEDLAAGLQRHCENLVARFVAYWCDRLSPGRAVPVCLVGGVAANVRINQVVAELPQVDNIFVFPHMGDGGLAVGAALACQAKLTGRPPKTALETVYLGPAYDRAAIEAALAEAGDAIVVEEPADKTAAAVESLINGKVVGYFDGRMEFGPRSLGARSILFHTRDQQVNEWLNRRLDRTEFMPFAPVTPIELAERSYKGWSPDHVAARFMTRTYHCTDAFVASHPAVVHVDGTARPQIVDAERNGDYYALVSEYCRRTGECALINTSFNQHEEPIVCSPANGVNGLLNGMIDVLYIGPFKVLRRA